MTKTISLLLDDSDINAKIFRMSHDEILLNENQPKLTK